MIEIVTEPIVLQYLIDAVASPEAGAISTFQGVVRNHNKGRGVLYLEYECYQPMALKEMERIVQQAYERWPLKGLALVHRIGKMEILEVSVAIAVSSAHRGDSLAATQFAIDTLKKTVPIWKKEYWEDGSMWLEKLLWLDSFHPVKALRRLQAWLAPDETVECAAWGIYSSFHILQQNSFKRRGLMALTNHRLLFFRQVRQGAELETLPLSYISEPELEAGRWRVCMLFAASGNTCEMCCRTYQPLKQLAYLIRKRQREMSTP